MKIRMRVSISGTRSGEDWPTVGGVLEVDDAEGMHLCQAALAEPVIEDETPVETATAPAAEVRPAPVKRARK